MKEFETTDIVELLDDERLFFVTGVIHDDARLFVTYNNEKEIEVSFDRVINRWAHKEL